MLQDDALEKIFKPPLTMFTMNTQLSKHCFPAGVLVAATQSTLCCPHHHSSSFWGKWVQMLGLLYTCRLLLACCTASRHSVEPLPCPSLTGA